MGDVPLNPATSVTIAQARSLFSGWHFAKESLSDAEHRALLAAEGLLHQIDGMHGGFAHTSLTDDELAEVAQVVQQILQRRTGE